MKNFIESKNVRRFGVVLQVRWEYPEFMNVHNWSPKLKNKPSSILSMQYSYIFTRSYLYGRNLLRSIVFYRFHWKNKIGIFQGTEMSKQFLLRLDRENMLSITRIRGFTGMQVLLYPSIFSNLESAVATRNPSTKYNEQIYNSLWKKENRILYQRLRKLTTFQKEYRKFTIDKKYPIFGVWLFAWYRFSNNIPWKWCQLPGLTAWKWLRREILASGVSQWTPCWQLSIKDTPV